jgi:hypothetical protein
MSTNATKPEELDITLPDAQGWQALGEAADLHRQRMQDARRKSAQRRLYAVKLFDLSKCWLGCVLLLVFLSSLRPDDKGCFTGLRLSDAVLITLLTTTTTAVLGLFVIVAKWLFSSDSLRASAEQRNPS